MQQAGDDGLIRKALFEGFLLDRLQIPAEDPDVDAAVLPQGFAGIAGVAAAVAPARFRGAPFAALTRFQKSFSSLSSFIVLGLLSEILSI